MQEVKNTLVNRKYLDIKRRGRRTIFGQERQTRSLNCQNSEKLLMIYLSNSKRKKNLWRLCASGLIRKFLLMEEVKTIEAHDKN